MSRRRHDSLSKELLSLWPGTLTFDGAGVPLSQQSGRLYRTARFEVIDRGLRF